ncbi:hypothetical protein ACFFLS_18620 [Flavobacterium procerum]|uniref:Uncharacterized protein n=1 Tax=Flavobacterium procerum TaxID=1455569 RepID=A0ABV6BUF2_9FLAO
MLTKYYFLGLFLSIHLYGQVPEIETNYTKKDSATNPLLQTFLKDYDFVLTYSEQCCAEQYNVLALKNGKWKSWTYLSNFIQWKKEGKNGPIKIDTIKTGTFFGNGKDVNSSKVNKLLAKFKENDFWKLKNDSLNQTRIIQTYIDGGDTIRKKAVITDGKNYVFNVLTRNNARKIQSYYPEYFVKLFPDMTDRKKFIESRDYFLDWWKKFHK